VAITQFMGNSRDAWNSVHYHRFCKLGDPESSSFFRFLSFFNHFLAFPAFPNFKYQETAYIFPWLAIPISA